MALVFILRNTAKTQGSLNITSNFLKSTRIAVANAKNFTNLTKPQINNGKFLCNPSLLKRNMSDDHSKLWPLEKAVTISLLAIVPATFLYPLPLFDNLFALAVVAHMHWGLEACVVDYIRPIIFGPVVPKLSLGLLYIISAATLGGLLYFNYNDIGIGMTVQRLWEIKE